MSDIIHKIFEISDIFRYLLEFLNFDDKIRFSKLINKNLLKNIDIFDKKYNKKDLSEYFHICGECIDNLSNDMYFTLSYKYNNDIIFTSFEIKENIEFIYSNCYYIAVRAFLEILDNENIVLNIEKFECIFQLELNENIYNLIYDKMQYIYENAIKNNLLDVFCEKCGDFGHCSLSENCALYNEFYRKKELNYYVKEVIDDIINDVFKINIRNKIIKNKKKHLCKSCNLKFFNKNCQNKLCKDCCYCDVHIPNLPIGLILLR